MRQDPIIEEIHQIRARIAEAYGNNIHAICEAARRGELLKSIPASQSNAATESGSFGQPASSLPTEASD